MISLSFIQSSAFAFQLHLICPRHVFHQATLGCCFHHCNPSPKFDKFTASGFVVVILQSRPWQCGPRRQCKSFKWQRWQVRRHIFNPAGHWFRYHFGFQHRPIGFQQGWVPDFCKHRAFSCELSAQNRPGKRRTQWSRCPWRMWCYWR